MEIQSALKTLINRKNIMNHINYTRHEVVQTLESLQFNLDHEQQSEYYQLKQSLDDLDNIQAEDAEYSHLLQQVRDLKNSVEA